MRCIAVCIGHTEAVASVAFSRTGLSFAVTVRNLLHKGAFPFR